LFGSFVWEFLKLLEWIFLHFVNTNANFSGDVAQLFLMGKCNQHAGLEGNEQTRDVCSSFAFMVIDGAWAQEAQNTTGNRQRSSFGNPASSGSRTECPASPAR
jgi:hypothetical protein